MQLSRNKKLKEYILLDFLTECNYIVHTMKVAIIKIGNSRGIRIPKPVFEQCGFEDKVEMEIHNRELVIRSNNKPRDGWEKAFQSMSKNGDDNLILKQVAEDASTWDEEEWEWNNE